MIEDPNKDIPEPVQMRLAVASRERFYAELLQAIDSLLGESGHDWAWLDAQMRQRFQARLKEDADPSVYIGWFDNHPLKERIGDGNFGMNVLVDIGQCFGLEPYLLWRPRTMRLISRERVEA